MNMQLKRMGNLYLVVDPAMGSKTILPKVKGAVEGGVDMIQLWNHWSNAEPESELILSICELAHAHNVPVIIHEQWQWLAAFPLDGVHFDEIPDNLDGIKQSINRPCLMGITCGNEEEKIQWAIDNKLDYISFCSMYPSSTSNSCELVKPELVKEICDRGSIQVYVAGGVTIENAAALMALGIDGIAVVSGIMGAADSVRAAQTFKQALNQELKSSIL